MALQNVQATELLKVGDFAKRAGISEVTARRWIALGRVGHVRLGVRAVRVSLAELNRLVVEGTRPARQVR